jgi:hypothetical protein
MYCCRTPPSVILRAAVCCLACAFEINTSVQVDEAAGEYDAAKEYNFVEKMREQRKHVKLVEGDGNCMFRSIADQVYGDEEMYMVLPLLVVRMITRRLTNCNDCRGSW